MFAGIIAGAGILAFFRAAVHTVGRAAQSNLPQRHKVLSGEKMVHGAAGLKRTVNFSPVQPGQKVIGFDVHQLHLIGIIEHTVRHAFAHCNACNSGYNVVQAFQMLNIHGGVHINAKRQQFFDILAALSVPAALRVGMGKLVHKKKGRAACDGSVQVKFAQRHVFVFHAQRRQLFQSLQQGERIRTRVRLDVSGHNVGSRRECRVCGFQHGVGFSHARSIAEEYLQSAAHMRRIGLLLLDLMQNPVGVRPFVLHENASCRALAKIGNK